MEPRFEPNGIFRDSSGREWHPEVVEATRRDRDFYLGYHPDRLGHARPGYIDLLLQLASAYRQAGWHQSAFVTEQDVADLKFILGVT